MIASLSASGAAGLDGTKVISASKRFAADIGARWPLPKAERESLAAIVLKVAERSLVPLASAAGRDPAVRIADDGRFEVAFALDPAFVRQMGAGDPAAPIMTRLVSEMVAFSKEWIAGPRDSLVYRSAAAHTFLIRPEVPSADDLARFGLTGLPKCTVLKSLCAGFIEAGKLASKTALQKTRLSIAAIAETIPVGAQDTNGRKFKGMIEDRNKWDLMGDLLEGDWPLVERAISIILPIVDGALAKIARPDAVAKEAFRRYFKSAEPWVMDFVAEKLGDASGFLSAGRRSDYRHWSEYLPDTGNLWPDENGRSIPALAINGLIYLNLSVQSFSPGELPFTLLHEALHLYVGGNPSAGGRDHAYRGEARLEQLTTSEALHNPDSYVALIEAF